MSVTETFLWHDYETFGADPFFDRPAQFAAARTDASLKLIEQPVSWYCVAADDVLPDPEACLITGITPQRTREYGLTEAEFAARIHVEMMRPGTCSAGYNSIRFDDAVSRNLLYRNLRDPYEREYRNGNSRFDLIDLARMCYALRPAGIEWPQHAEAGTVGVPEPSFRLQDLAAANGLEQTAAHEALSDVHATIALARLIRSRQPRLYDWALQLRKTDFVMGLLGPSPLVHSSARTPAVRGCTTLVLPLAMLPDRPKCVAVFDLMADPEPLITLSAPDIADLVFTPVADLPQGLERLPLKVIHCNHVPMLAPASTLHGVDLARIGLDEGRCNAHAERLIKELDRVRPRVLEALARPDTDELSPADQDPDQMLYSGGFFSAHDRQLMNQILTIDPKQIRTRNWTFQDPRLPLMLFRYRARNFPETLTSEEIENWDHDRAQRLIAPVDPRQMSYERYLVLIQQAREVHRHERRALDILDQLEAWAIDTGIRRLAGEPGFAA